MERPPAQDQATTVERPPAQDMVKQPQWRDRQRKIKAKHCGRTASARSRAKQTQRRDRQRKIKQPQWRDRQRKIKAKHCGRTASARSRAKQTEERPPAQDQGQATTVERPPAQDQATTVERPPAQDQGQATESVEIEQQPMASSHATSIRTQRQKPCLEQNQKCHTPLSNILRLLNNFSTPSLPRKRVAFLYSQHGHHRPRELPQRNAKGIPGRQQKSEGYYYSEGKS